MRELPAFAKVAREYEKKGVRFIGVSLDNTDDKAIARIKETLKNAGVEYTNVFNDKKLMEKLPEFSGIPTTFIVNKNGVVIWNHTGSITEENLTKLASQLVEDKKEGSS